MTQVSMLRNETANNPDEIEKMRETTVEVVFQTGQRGYERETVYTVSGEGIPLTYVTKDKMYEVQNYLYPFTTVRQRFSMTPNTFTMIVQKEHVAKVLEMLNE